MTDQEIIQGLIDRDERVTYQFFYVKCRPLLASIMRSVFSYHVDYDEMVAELYEYMMANEGHKFRQFEYRSSIYQWLKVTALRFFIQRRKMMIENASKESPYEITDSDIIEDTAWKTTVRLDVAKMLDMMENRRYADVIRHLVLQDEEPEKYAVSIGVTPANLYNIKKRAMAAFTRIVLKYYSYGTKP